MASDPPTLFSENNVALFATKFFGVQRPHSFSLPKKRNEIFWIGNDPPPPFWKLSENSSNMVEIVTPKKGLKGIVREHSLYLPDLPAYLTYLPTWSTYLPDLPDRLPTLPTYVPDLPTRPTYLQALAGSRESRDFMSGKIPGFLKLKSRELSGSVVTVFSTPWNTLTPKIGKIDKNIFHFL